MFLMHNRSVLFKEVKKSKIIEKRSILLDVLQFKVE